MSQTPDRLRHSLGSQIAVQALRLVISIGLSGWLARYLGPTSLGKLSYALALVGLVAPLGNLGVPGSLSALLCETPQLPGLTPTALLIELAGTAIIALTLLPVAFFSQDPIIAILIAIAVLGNLFSSVEVLEAELLVEQRGTLLARIGLFPLFANALLTSFAILLQAPLIIFGWLQMLQAMLRACCVGFVRSSRETLQQLSQVNAKAATALIKRGLPLVVAGLSVSFYMRSDQVMLQWLKGAEAVGQYSVAVKISETLYFLPMILSTTYFSRVGKAGSLQLANQELKRLYQYSWLLGIAMMLANIVIFPPMIPVLFGDSFEQAQLALCYSGPAAFAVSMGYASSCWLQLLKLEWIATARTGLGALVNVVLNFALIPKFGATGAAVATSISYLVATFAITLLLNKSSRRNTLLLLYPFALENPG